METVDVLARMARIEDEVERLTQGDQTGAEAVLVRTQASGSYPTSAQRYYPVKRVDISGPETEGASPTLGESGETFTALNMGSAIPPPGTYVIVVQLFGRWVFRHG